MPITLSDHAKFQLKKRKIAQVLVRKAVQNPDEILASFRGRKLRRMRVGGKILQVVTVTEGSKITIISGYYLRRVI